MSIPSKVLAAYDIGPVRSEKLLSSGLIHQTYQIRTQKGMYILQRLHAILSSDGVGDDFLAVTEHLRKKRFTAPQCVVTRDGEPLAKDGAHVWRMQTCLPGKTYTSFKSPAMAKEAGNIFARFHKTMDGLKYRFQSELVLHQTEKILAEFKKTVKAQYGSGLIDGAASEIEFVLKEFPKQLLPKLPKRVIHGDPKISNILFDAKGKASAIVDLDTCNRRPLLVELGDAFRSWCGKEEDDPKNEFRLDVFKRAWSGYAAGAKGFMTKQEQKYVPQAIGTITLELTARFITDYFNDSYFGWNQKRYASRREHNLARARGQLALYKDLQKKLPQVKKIVGV